MTFLARRAIEGSLQWFGLVGTIIGMDAYTGEGSIPPEEEEIGVVSNYTCWQCELLL
jgi:hypothetical protein